MKTLCLISLGCNKNLVDSEVMLGQLCKYRLIDSPKNADVVIVNTCGFIESAKQESVEKILQVISQKPKNSILVVSGCLSQRYTNELRAEIPEIDIITGVGEYDKIDLLIDSHIKRAGGSRDFKDSKDSKDSTNAQAFLIDSHKRVITGSNIHTYIKISEGCNQQCSFCVIPHIKGKLHSRSLESCLKEINRLVENGYKDFSFIAQDSSSYMRDLGQKDGLIKLIDEVEKLDGIRSARILYLYPTSTSNRLIERIGESNIFQNYFDMPIQHISNNVLKAMRRKCDKQRHIELLKQMRNLPDSFIRTTLLIGHPGESERDFAELVEFVNEFIFDRINIFAFSCEENTKAYKMPQIPQDVVNERIDMLESIIKKQQKKILNSYKNKKINAIIDGISTTSDLLFTSRDIKWEREIDGEILINENLSPNPLKAGYYEVEIQSTKGGILIGKAIKEI